MPGPTLAPAGFVPLHGAAYSSEDGSAVSVSPSTPLPVSTLSPQDAALRAGMSYLASTPIAPVASGQRFYTIMSNPAGSGRNVFLYNRIFGNNNAPNDEVIEYRAHVAPTATLTGAPAPVTASSLIGGGSPSQTRVTFQVATDGEVLMGGTEATGEQLPNGMPYRRPLTVLIPPGVRLGFSLRGAGGTNFAASLSVIFEWFEEPI